MNTFHGLLAIGTLLLITATVEAAPVSEHREHRQQARIAHGVSSGALTVTEFRRLRQGQLRVDAAQATARADGIVTLHERRRIDRLQDRQSARITRQSHDRQWRGS
jgi:hypothetical protein